MEFVISMALSKIKEQLESQSLNITAAAGGLNTILRASEVVKDELAQALAQAALASFAETKGLVDAALEECARLEALGLREITEESSAELGRIMGQYVNRLCEQALNPVLELSNKLVSFPPYNPLLMKELAKGSSAAGVSVGSLDTLSGIEFEGLVTRLLEHMGFRAETTKASGDGGVDVVATFDGPLTGGRYLIQCKRYAPESTVGAATVREFYGALTADRRAIKGILITTSAFTAQAAKFAEGLPIELVARDKLQGLLERHGLLHAATPALHPLARLHGAYCSIFESLANLAPANSSLAELRSNCENMAHAVTFSIRAATAFALGEIPQLKDRVPQLLDSAIRLHEQKTDTEAIKLLREAAQLQPENPDVWLWLGICYNSVGLHDDQIAALREAVRLKPDFHNAWLWLGIGLHCVGDLDGAINAVTRANTIPPDDAFAWNELGTIYSDKGVEEGANFAFRKAVKIKPDFVRGWWNLGLFQYKHGRNSEALSAFQEALRTDPDDTLSWEWLVRVCSRTGDPARMQNALNRLQQLDPAKARELRRELRV